MSALPKEFEGPQWNIAAALPVLGDDVKIAREMSSIAGRLADEAVSPLFDQWDSITQTLSGDGGLNYVERASALLEELPKFAKTITHAKQVVYECEERANSLPVAHIDQLNDAASELKETMESIADMLRVFDRVADAVSP
jgi:hypothetical protein